MKYNTMCVCVCSVSSAHPFLDQQKCFAFLFFRLFVPRSDWFSLAWWLTVDRLSLGYYRIRASIHTSDGFVAVEWMGRKGLNKKAHNFTFHFCLRKNRMTFFKRVGGGDLLLMNFQFVVVVVAKCSTNYPSSSCEFYRSEEWAERDSSSRK